MKTLCRIIALLGLAGAAYAGPSGPPAGNYILNVSTSVATPAFRVSSGTVKTQLKLDYGTKGNLIWLDSDGIVTTTSTVPAGGDVVKASTQTLTGFNTFVGSTTLKRQVVIQTTNSGSSQGSGGALFINATNESGMPVQVYSSSANSQAFLNLINSSTGYANSYIYVNGASSTTGKANAYFTDPNPNIQFVETGVVAPAGKYEFMVLADTFQLRSMNSGGSAYKPRIGMTHPGALCFYETNDNGHFVCFSASNTIASNVNWTLPAADSSGCFQSDGAGNLSIAPCGGSGIVSPGTFTWTNNGFGINIGTATMGSASSTALGNNPWVSINSSGTSQALTITNYGYPSGGVQNELGVVNIKRPLGDSPGASLVLVDSVTDAQVGAGVLELWSDNPLHNDPLFWIHRTSSNSSPEMRWDSPSPNMEMVNTSTDNAHGLGKWEPFAEASQGVDLQINNRAWSNSTFETLAYWHPLSKKDVMPGLYLNPQNVTDDGGILASSDTTGVSMFTLDGHTIGITAPQQSRFSYTLGLPILPKATGLLLYNNGNRGGNFSVRQTTWTDTDFTYLPTTGVKISTLTLTGQMTGAGLTDCSSASSAVSWASATGKFGCNTISGGGGSGSGYALEPATVTIQANLGVTATSITVNQSAYGTAGLNLEAPSGGPDANVNYLTFGFANIPLGYLGIHDSGSLDPQGVTILDQSQNEQIRFTDSGGGVWVTNHGGLSIAGLPTTTNLAPQNGLYVQTGIVASTAAFASFNATTTSMTVTGNFLTSSGTITNFTAAASTITTVTASTYNFPGQGNTRVLFMNGANLGTSSTFTWNGSTMSATDVSGSLVTATKGLYATGSDGLTSTYSISAGSYTGAGLGACGDSTHALGFTSTGTYTCQSIPGAGGGAGSPLAITTGTLTTYANPAISSPTTVAVLLQSQFNQTASGTTAYISINVSSITALGPSPNLNALSGTVTAGEFPTLTGDITTPGGSLATTAAGTQANITTFTHALTATSSMTITAGPGLTTNFLIVGSSVAISSNTILGAATYYANGVIAGASMSATELSGVLQAAQEPAHTGDVTNTAGSLAMTAAGTQANITNFSGSITHTSSLTVTGATLISTLTITGPTYNKDYNTVTANYVITSTDSLVLCNALSNPVTLTLPLASASNGQILTIQKTDLSASSCTIRGAGSDQIVSTGTWYLSAQAQQIVIQSTGGTNLWARAGPMEAPEAYIGGTIAANVAETVAASSSVYCTWYGVSRPSRVTGMRFSASTANGTMDVAIIDSNGNRLASSGLTTMPGTGTQTLSFTSAANILPGTYALCAQISNVTGALRGLGNVLNGGFLNTETTGGIPATLTVPGTASAIGMSLEGIVTGGGP